MIRRRVVITLTFLIVLALLAVLALQRGQTPLDAAARRGIVATLSEALRDRYVIPEKGERAAAAIVKASDAAQYDGLTDRAVFARRLSADVRAIVQDKHLNIIVPSSEPWLASVILPLLRGSAVTRVERRSDGIGYIEVVSFPPPEEFKRILDRSMSSLKGSRALVIDVRRNGGGSPASVAYFESFLVEQGRLLSTIIIRIPKTKKFTRQMLSSSLTPVSFADLPVYVLASKNTFSGGEDFAYTVQALKRAIIVGEVTGGGANPTGPVDLSHGVIATIPFGRSESPITKTNWEGRGVQPDVAVPAEGALSYAIQKLGGKPVP